MDNVKLNTKFLIKEIDNGPLTPTEFIYLFYLLENKKYEYKNEVDLNKMQDLKLIKIVGTRIVSRDYFIIAYLDSLKINEYIPKEIVKEYNKEIKKIAEKKDDNVEECFEKLVTLYPSREGTRVLINKTTAYPKFKICLKEDGIDKILKGLENQLLAKKQAAMKRPPEFFDAMQNLATWLYQKTYLMWVDVETKKEETNTKRV